MPKTRIKWRAEVDADDAKAAETYLSLVFSPKRAAALKSKLRGAQVTPYPAKDVLRASGLKMLDKGDPDVAEQVKKIKAGKELSAILLVREDDQARLIVADGFHRLCAVMVLDEKAPVRCKIV